MHTFVYQSHISCFDTKLLHTCVMFHQVHISAYKSHKVMYVHIFHSIGFHTNSTNYTVIWKLTLCLLKLQFSEYLLSLRREYKCFHLYYNNRFVNHSPPSCIVWRWTFSVTNHSNTSITLCSNCRVTNNVVSTENKL